MTRTVLAGVLVLAASAAFADRVEGVWQTQVDDGAYAHVTISPCGVAFCGVISQSFKDGAPFASNTMGKEVVIDMVPARDGAYDGKVWRPSNNSIDVGGIQLSGDSMTLAGCVAGGLICKMQTWTRVT